MDDVVERYGISVLENETRDVLTHIHNYENSCAKGMEGAKAILADEISEEQVDNAFHDAFDKWNWDNASPEIEQAYKKLEKYRDDEELWELRKQVKIYGCPLEMERTLTDDNIDDEIARYYSSIESIGLATSNLQGMALFKALKREQVGEGPYPHVTLFEAANRIMTDLVILYGVKWLLENKTFPFDTYVVEYGNEDRNDHDIMAENKNGKLIGEAFNVAKSFFQGKKGSMLKKIRKAENTAEYKIIIANSDSVEEGYTPDIKEGEYYVFVNVESGEAKLMPDRVDGSTSAVSNC